MIRRIETMSDNMTFPFMEHAPEEKPCSASDMDRTAYFAECVNQWDGDQLQDALGNWETWQELHDDLLGAMRKFRSNPSMRDLSGKYHNPKGTLAALLWSMQEAWQPDNRRLDPLLDFCEHYQRVFLRRGLVIYCTMLLRMMRRPNPNPPAP